ncbi:hypothetical protein MMC26_002577 [Xylographa opegraphella]|nr:hypothetical protein [Xylographa opegraphella]
MAANTHPPLPDTEAVLTSTYDHLKASAANTTSYLNLSSKDLLLVVPRLAARASSFALDTIPEAFENIFGGETGGRIIAEATGEGGAMAAANVGIASGELAAAAGAAATQATGGPTSSFSQAFSFQQIRTLGGVFTYMTSKWALGCFTVAIILNRTQIYATSRRHLTLNWQLRFALRIIPILMFLSQIQSLLRSMRCQTSPNYSQMRYGNSDKHIIFDFAGDGGFLHWLSSLPLFWETEEQSCLAVHMIHSEEGGIRTGSLSLLWPIFQSLCLGQFVETLSCAVQGRPLMTETGMSIFEHSLAFAEAEAMVTNQLGLGPFGARKPAVPRATNVTITDTEPMILVTRSSFLNRLNTPPEVLLMALISCLNNLSSHVLGVLGLQSNYRLLNTGFWGLCFMASFVWGFMGFNLEHGIEAGILRFPTVCIVGFIPHLLILVGIFFCGCIYSIALLLSVLSPPPDLPHAATWAETFRNAHSNMQANMQLSNIQFNMTEDFYTALLRVGFAALTAASEAVFLNEGRPIAISRLTWLEEDRINEIERSRAAAIARGSAFSKRFIDTDSTGVASGVAFAEEQVARSPSGTRQWQSGYARERTTKILKGGSAPKSTVAADGVGAYQRGGRYVLAWEFLSSIFWLLTGWFALGLIKVLDTFGIRRRPRWLSKTLGTSKITGKAEEVTSIPQSSSLDFWLLSDDGVLSLPENDDVDVEFHTKRRQEMASRTWNEEEERKLDSNLYSWWTHGGWWGERDSSGDYTIPPEEDDDTTSLISETTAASAASDAGWESNPDDQEGRRTPTQQEPHPRSRESSPPLDLPLDASLLARLLNPRDADSRSEARILAHHLSSDRILTRARYQHLSSTDNAHVLTSTRYRPAGFKPSAPDGKLFPFEEADLLEYLILRSRAQRDRSGEQASAWQDGADGLGAGGPQCVVCQSAPRTILSWPCRCLSLCEDCRVSLAMNNFATCVCCRQDVVGFSRLFVP